MSAAPRPQPIDAYVACYAGLAGWGGGLSMARGAVEACRLSGLRADLLGVRSAGAASAREAGLPRGRWWWRFQSLVTARCLASWLRQLRPPEKLFIAVSPFWVVAARRAWPGVRIAYLFPCLLTNCLPRAGAPRRSLSDRLNLALLARVERAALRSADRVIAPTRAACDEIAAFEPRSAARLRRAPFGCHKPAVSANLRESVRAGLGLRRGEFALLLAGVMDRNKAFDLAIHELARCDPRTRLVLAGGGPLRDELERLVGTLGLRERVIFAGPQPTLDPLLSACDAAISTSHYDTYPNVLLEALAAGRPIVAPRHDPPRVYAGIGERVRDGGGALYDRTFPAALADAVNRLARDPAHYAKLAREAQLVGAQISWDALAGEIADMTEPRRRSAGDAKERTVISPGAAARALPADGRAAQPLEGAHVR